MKNKYIKNLAFTVAICSLAGCASGKAVKDSKIEGIIDKSYAGLTAQIVKSKNNDGFDDLEISDGKSEPITLYGAERNNRNRRKGFLF